MKLEALIAGTILGYVIGFPPTQKMIVNAVVKGAGTLTDMLNNKKGGAENVPTKTVESEPKE